MKEIQWAENRMPKTADTSLPIMSLENLEK